MGSHYNACTALALILIHKHTHAQIHTDGQAAARGGTPAAARSPAAPSIGRAGEGAAGVPPGLTHTYEGCNALLLSAEE